MLVKRFYRSISVIFKDKVIFTLFLIPVFMGGLLYFLLGTKLYELVMVYGQGKVRDFIGENAGSGFVYWSFFILFMGVIFFLVNWTFVMVVSILASPFNDFMSARVERKYTNHGNSQDAGPFFNRIFKVIWNECKKISIILILTLIASSLSFFPFFAPLGFVISAFLLSVQFIDYSWSRHEWSIGVCFKDSIKHCFSYTFAGALFMFFMSLPFVNIIFSSVAVVYFTLLWADKNKPKEKVLGKEAQAPLEAI